MFDITVQYNVESHALPSVTQFKEWTAATLQHRVSKAEVTLRITDATEMTRLNETFRQKTGPTNVLAFPLLMPDATQPDVVLMGDIVMCAEVITAEAQVQHKTLEAHFAHMVVHGTLHLLGFNHEHVDEANLMEAEEVLILKELGFSDPYIVKQQENINR